MPAINFKGLYELKADGLSFGKTGIEISQDAAHYDIACDIAFTGLLKLFIKHSSRTVVAARGADYHYSDIAYETNYHTRDKKREVKLTYARGRMTSEYLDPPENHAKRPEVSMAMKQDAADPLTLLLAMREKLRESMQKNNAPFSLNVYDGRRLTEVHFTPQGKHQLGNTPVIAVAVRRKLLAGFTQSELAEYDPNEPTLYIYFSDDARLIPIRFEVTPFWGTLSATLVKECGKGESCLLGIKE